MSAPAPGTHGMYETCTARFVLVRHGEAEGNRELRHLGMTDAPLTPHGAEQARQVATGVRPFGVSAIYTSPLSRARATAEAIGAVLGLEPRVDARLREQDYGAWENLTRDEARARDPKRFAAWENGLAVAPPDGESFEEVRGRVTAAFEGWTVAYAGEVVALVSHVGPIKMLLCAALGLPARGALRLWLDPASICVVDWRVAREGRAASGIVRLMNGVAHLEAPVRWLEHIR